MKNYTAYKSALLKVLRNEDRMDASLALLKGDIGKFGYYMLSDSEEELDTLLAKDNLFRRFGTVVKVTESDKAIAVVTSATKARITKENESFPSDNDDVVKFAVRRYKIASLVKINQNIVLDSRFGVLDFLTNHFTRRFAKAEEDLFLNGSGTDEPLGVLKSAGIGAVSRELTYDDIVKLYFSVDAGYRENGVFVMSDETALRLRTLKSENGTYLWNSQNDTIFGKPVVTSVYMTDTATPVMFGDLSQVWVIARSSLCLKVLSELFIMDGQIGYAAHEFIDVQLIRPEAVKILRIDKSLE